MRRPGEGGMSVARAREFYARQDEWTGVYQGSVQTHHRDNAKLLRELVGPAARTVLELGCGGGQNAAACVMEGFRVTAVDFVPSVLANARRLAASVDDGRLVIVDADLLSLESADRFDVVAMWDTFGIVSDDETVALLNRIRGWLAPSGCAVLEIYGPRYWERAAGRENRFGAVRRRYGFDSDTRRMTDRWWPGEDESRAVTQSLRCYAPNELRGLAERASLVVTEIRSRGAWDFEREVFLESVGVDEAMQYVARLVPLGQEADMRSTGIGGHSPDLTTR